MTRIGQSPNPTTQRSIGNPPPQRQEGDKLHTVQRGDTLTHIARSNNVPVNDLIQANPQIQDPNKIWPGDQVRIPGGAEQTTPAQTTTPVGTPQNNTYSTGGSTPHQTPVAPTPQQTVNPELPTARPGELARSQQSEANGSQGQVWGTRLNNGAEVSVLGGSAQGDGYGGGDLRGHVLSLDRDGMHVGVGEGRLGGAAEISDERVNLSVRADATGINATTGNTNELDVGSKIGDIGGEATIHVEADGSAGRIGAGYRANIAEVNGGVGGISDQSTDDFRTEARVAVGAPSGGAFVSWNDRDNDGATNYRLDLDVPIPGTPLGVGVSYETERPVSDGLAVLGLVNPITAPISAGYLAGRLLDFF
ncbi:MAG: LysM peptidoglycan-binding domain-containing protein [Deltaproteobacteria bacterium]|nr:MAG: LysM peptidoglycan-binding domain-containing protein [Deltaproteobacteria bacterium]